MSILFSMKNEHDINIRLIFVAKFEAIALVFVALFSDPFTKNRVVRSSWTSDYEFCQTRWFEFLDEKQKWNKTCGKNVLDMSPCCIAEKDYLLQRFKRYSHTCPLEGKYSFTSLSSYIYSQFVPAQTLCVYLIVYLLRP